MLKLRPDQLLGEKFPAMHLVRSSWLARLLAKITFFLLVGLIFAAIFVPWQQTSKGEGRVVARLPQLRPQTVTSQSKGVISYVKPDLREGMLVNEGDLIMELSPFAKDQLALTTGQQSNLEDKLKQLTEVRDNLIEQVKATEDSNRGLLEATESELRAARNKWKKAENDVLDQEARYRQAEVEEHSNRELVGQFISEVEYQALKNKLASEYAKLEKSREAEDEAFNELEAKQQLLESKRDEVDQKNLEARGKVSKANSEINSVEKELKDIRSKLGELDRNKIFSPSRGRIQAIMGQAGTNTVKEGDRLFTIVPDTEDLAVELHIRGNDVPLIHVGDHVRLQFEGWPALQFVGWPSAAVGTFGGEVIAINPTDDVKNNFKIIVGPVVNHENTESHPQPTYPDQEKWPDSRYLRQGVRVNGWVILKTVPLGFEIWRQLNGFPITISDSEPGEEKAKDPKPPKLK